VLRSIEAAGLPPGSDIALALERRASEFFDKKAETYTWDKKPRTGRSSSAFYQELTTRYRSSRSRMARQDDWEGWKLLTERSAARCSWSATISSSPTPCARRESSRDSKRHPHPSSHQIGTLRRRSTPIRDAARAGYRSLISHRSGETEAPSSPISRSPPRGPDQDGQPFEKRPRGEVTTAPCGSPSNSKGQVYAGKTPVHPARG